MNQKAENKSSAKVMTLILVCFFFSGMTGLIYEILWTRMIVKVIGGAPFAVSIILTVFMAGLGLGSYIASRKIDKIKHQLKLVRIYGILEIAIGAYCLVLPLMLKAFEPLYAIMYNRLFEHFMLYNLLTFVGCSLLLIIPVICMGATLPILCRFYVTRLSHLASHAGRLYGLNTIGAAFGSLLCGFWLIANLGMTGTLIFAVLANVLIGLICIIASYKMTAPPIIKDEQKTNDTSPDTDTAKTFNSEAIAALIIFAISGFCAMSYEVIWAKLLGLIIGPTTYSFTIVLVTFITCLAMGSMFFGWLGDRVKKPIWLLLYTQIAAAIFALLISQLLGNSQFFFAKLIYHNQNSFAVLNILKALILFTFMLPPTICLGATFPLVGKICTRSLQKVGRTIGFAYAINTIGAVLGSFCAGFILVPFIGKENGLRIVFAIQIVTSLLVACWILIIKKQKGLKWATIVIPALAGLILCAYFPNWNRKALSMGRYHRFKAIQDQVKETGWLKALYKGSDILAKEKIGKIVYYGDGIAGFTAVTRTENLLGHQFYTMLNSGKPDASSSLDMPTQTLLAHFPMLFHKNPKTVMVLGHASGITSGETLCYPIERLDVLEISREVVKASEFFEPWNRNVLANPKTNLIIQDGRAHLKLTNREYDVIISEPSNPWMAGLATLFTEDFFKLAKNKLKPDGIFCQWLHSYQMDWNTFALIGRTVASVFENNLLVSLGHEDYLLIGFKNKKGLDINVARQNLKFVKNSTNIVLPSPDIFYRFIGTEDLKALFGPGKLNTDNNPLLEFDAPKKMHTKDPAIRQKVDSIRVLKPRTQRIIKAISEDIDNQIDFAEFAFSVHYPFANMVDLSEATQEQKDRFFAIIENYCRENTIDYSIIPDEKLKRKCRLIHIKAMEKRIDVVPDKVIMYHAIADLYRENKNFAKAESYYHKALELNPKIAALHNNMAITYHYQGKIQKAIEHYNEALRIDPDLPGARNNLNQAMAQQRNLLQRRGK
ncbi:MAG: tetratricopeptide repeat protein [Planctomycetes bacterium]|nr:tetratricopeptide repeat protein [Planctomycetota bacterium]